MKAIVAPGREVSINWRRYLAGDELPDVPGIAIESLVKSGVVKTDRVEHTDRAEPAEQPAHRTERRR